MKRIEFKVGQKVVALNTKTTKGYQPRIKGRTYNVLDVMYCSRCGKQKINIMGKTDATYIVCGCGNEYSTVGKMWTCAKHFAPIDNIEASISEAVANEDYETAQVLHEIMTSNLQEA